MKQASIRTHLSNIAKHGLFPALFYFLAFCLLTYPLILDFNTRFLTDNKDGFQNIWNIWWIKTAISQPGIYPSIWHTSLLHWPFGTTLYAHTLNPFNGYLALIPGRFLSPTQTFNFLVVFAFVSSGVTAYWLSYYLTRSHWGSLIGGFIFTFSSYHFAHYHGHLNLVSLEWIPLFILCWHILITRPGLMISIASAFTLWMVLLCDYYYFLYCVIAGGLMLIWYMIETKEWLRFIRQNYLIPFSVFLFLTVFATGQIIFSTFRLSKLDPFVGGHKPQDFSLDLLHPFIPGEAWKFGTWTQPFWSKIPIGLQEANVYLGYAVIVLMLYVLIKHRRITFADSSRTTIWHLLSAFFFIMALGPVLHVNGKAVYDKLMPYTLLETLLPFLKLSGVPIRMIMMVTLAASVLCALALRELWAGTSKNKTFAFLLLALLVFEILPRPLPSTSNGVPQYVEALAKLPNDGGVLDLAAPTIHVHLYYQTIHQKPMAYGYVSRLPVSTDDKEIVLWDTFRAQNFAKLWINYRIRYIVTTDLLQYESPLVEMKLIYQEGIVNIYRLECKCNTP